MTQKNSLSSYLLRKELARSIPAHRLSVSDNRNAVVIEPEEELELSYAVRVATTLGAKIVLHGILDPDVRPDSWHISIRLSRMTRILEFSPISQYISVQAGIQFSELQTWLEERGFALGFDPGIDEQLCLGEYMQSSFLGAYGPKFGLKTDSVICLKAVLPDGTLYESSNAPRRAVGPGFDRLVLCSGGRFGLIWAYTLRVHPAPSLRIHLGVQVRSISMMVEKLTDMIQTVPLVFAELWVCSRFQPQIRLLLEAWVAGGQLRKCRKQMLDCISGWGHVLPVGFEQFQKTGNPLGWGKRPIAQYIVAFDKLSGLVKAINKLLQSRPNYTVCFTGFTQQFTTAYLFAIDSKDEKYKALEREFERYSAGSNPCKTEPCLLRALERSFGQFNVFEFMPQLMEKL